MGMREALFLCLVVYYGSLCAQPNILFIESDDQSNQAVGAFGNPMMKTPYLDKLAEEGVCFTAAYNMGCWSPAVCIPSRTMLFYGKYLWESQEINKGNAPKSLPEMLKTKGYYTFMTGKWHAWGKAPRDIFDRVGSIQAGQLETYFHDDGHVTGITGEEAMDFIEGYDAQAPFFLYVAFNAPHVPRQAYQQYYDLYPVNEIKLPPSVKDGPLNPNIQYNYSPDPLKPSTMKSRVQQNNAMVTHMDHTIGRIFQALKNKDLYDNTLIVFMSDHGISFGENGVAGKVCLYEPSVTAPLIIKGPNFPAGKFILNRVYLQDIYPTLLEVLDIPVPARVDFKSLLPIIEHGTDSRNSIYLAMFDDQRAIITENKKLILYPKSGDLELYDLENDRWEVNDLKELDGMGLVIKNLVRQLASWQIITQDTLDLQPQYARYLR